MCFLSALVIKVINIIDFLVFSSMTKLSVNINKVATIRNSRGGNIPDLVQTAVDCQEFGADGITIDRKSVV